MTTGNPDRDFDAVVIGAGHNGLSAAATLSGKGKRVCVVERCEDIGGMSKTVALADGVSGPQIAHLLYNLNPAVARELGIADTLKTTPVPTVSLAPDGRHVVIDGDGVRFADGAAHPEAAPYTALRRRLETFAALLTPLSNRTPPEMIGELAGLSSLHDLAGLAKLGIGLKRLGKTEMREFLRIVLSNAYDLILDELDDTPLAGVLAADAVRGAWSGPRSPGTVFSLMYRLGAGGACTLPAGGMGAVVSALASVAESRGCRIRTGCGVARVLVGNDRVTGVELEDGTTISATAVLSSAGAKPSMLLAGAENYDVEAVRRLRNVRAKGTAAKVNLVLGKAPAFKGLSPDLAAGRLVIAPSADYVERAFNPVKYGHLSDAPVIEAVIPSLSDPDLCRNGKHVMSIIVQYVPHDPEGGWTGKARDEVSDLTVSAFAQHAPGLQDLIERCEVLTPADIERLTGAPGGHWHHGELSFDQLFTLRPVNGLSRYAFGPHGYYLCGAAAHPGGDVSGAAGRNAAMQLLKDGVLT